MTRLTLAALCATFALAGCGQSANPMAPKLASAASVSAPGPTLALGAIAPAMPLASSVRGFENTQLSAASGIPALPAPRFAPGDAEMLYDGDTFSAMEALVAKAQHSIRLDYYVFGGATAQHLADTLIAKHRAGVTVHVMLDSAFGTLAELKKESQPIYKQLVAAGVPVLLHSTQALPAKPKGTTIDHNKYFVIDEQEALVGSMNLATKFYHFHDLMMHVSGPVAADLAQQHDFDWYYANHPTAGAPPVSLVHADGTAPVGSPSVRLVGTGMGRTTGREALMALIANAKRSIHVQMHELGTGPVLDALIAARDRGVEVKLILDPGNVDSLVPLVHLAPKGVINAVAINQLVKAHMDVRTYRVDANFTTAHMKIGMFDGEALLAGSINWTQGGFEWVTETDLEIHGGHAPAQAEAQFQRDWTGHADVAKAPGLVALELGKIYQKLGG